METQSESGANQINPKLLIGAAILVTIAGVIILLAFVRPTTNTSNLLPILATPTSSQNESVSLTPVPVTFTDLNSDPLAYLNIPIQVSGSFIKLDSPACPRFSGPNPEWALVSEDLQLEAKGFERVVQILSPGTNMIVQGIWRLYQGPLGCGKGPRPDSSWYLQVQRIIQPNPLVGDGNINLVDIEGVIPGFPALVATGVPTIPPATIPPQANVTAAATATINQTLPTGTVDATGTIDSGTIGTPLGTLAATVTPAPDGSTPIPSTTPIATATAIPGGETGSTPTPQTPLPPTSTPTSGDPYLAPPTITPSPSPYP
jgi:hypothetical protein